MLKFIHWGLVLERVLEVGEKESSQDISGLLHQVTFELCPISNRKPLKYCRQERSIGQVQWLMPVSPALWEAKEGRSPEVRSLRPD